MEYIIIIIPSHPSKEYHDALDRDYWSFCSYHFFFSILFMEQNKYNVMVSNSQTIRTQVQLHLICKINKIYKYTKIYTKFTID